jgi:hypothetical protein
MGYRKIGEEFKEITIPHVVMEKELWIAVANCEIAIQ